MDVQSKEFGSVLGIKFSSSVFFLSWKNIIVEMYEVIAILYHVHCVYIILRFGRKQTRLTDPVAPQEASLKAQRSIRLWRAGMVINTVLDLRVCCLIQPTLSDHIKLRRLWNSSTAFDPLHH